MSLPVTLAKRGGKTAISRRWTAVRNYVDRANNDSSSSNKPKEERLEDIFADLFASQPPPSLRPPPSQTSAEDSIIGSPDLLGSAVDSPRRSGFSSRVRPKERLPDQTHLSRSMKRAQELLANVPRISKAGAPLTDRSRMSPKEAKAFNEILDQMYKDKETPASSSSDDIFGDQEMKPKPAFEARPGTSAKMGQLVPEPHRMRTEGPRPTSKRGPSAVMPTHEMEQEIYEEFDRKKEVINSLPNDLAIWAWAKNEWFSPPQAAPSTSNGAEESEQPSSIATGRSFPGSYPLILTHLISLFRDQFQNPHLALAAFSLARSHSIESYVAGCSTAAYNEVIKTHWDNFRNLRRVEECVREMAVNGVGWDRNTSKILSRIVETLSKTQLSSRSNFGEGQRRLEAEFGTQVLLKLGALEQRVEQDVEEKEKRVRMMLGKLSAERRRREAAMRPADMPEPKETLYENEEEWR